ncbi:MAG: EamA family transporter [Gallionellaceae bacterium]|nr:EamA family transporter [Gallionellaceae bacterium]
MTQGLLLALLSLLLYGVWGFSYKLLSIRGIQGEWAVSMVMLLGAAISAAIALWRAEPFPADKLAGSVPWLVLVLVAASGAIGNIFLIKAMAAPGFSAGVALAVSGAYPLVAALLAYLLLGEQIAATQAVGIAAIVFGVGLLTFR